MSQSGPTQDSLSRVYAEALYQLADEQGQLDTVAYEAQELAGMLEQHPDLGRLLSSRVIHTEDRRGILERLFEGKYTDVLHRFLQVASAKNRLGHLGSILATFAALLDEKRGVVKVDAHVAAPLDAGEADRVAEALSAALGGKEVQLQQHLDPGLIGGLKIQIGDELIDASVANQLKLMQRKLIESGQEKARTLS